MSTTEVRSYPRTEVRFYWWSPGRIGPKHPSRVCIDCGGEGRVEVPRTVSCVALDPEYDEALCNACGGVGARKPEECDGCLEPLDVEDGVGALIENVGSAPMFPNLAPDGPRQRQTRWDFLCGSCAHVAALEED